MPAPQRFAIKGRRAGETYHTPHGIVATDPIDGGARLNDEQKAYFENEYGLVKVAATAPVPEPEPLNERQQQRINENEAAARDKADQEARVEKAQLANIGASAAETAKK